MADKQLEIARKRLGALDKERYQIINSIKNHPSVLRKLIDESLTGLLMSKKWFLRAKS